MINLTTTHSQLKYHSWIRQNLYKLFPINVTEHVAYDIKVQPVVYLKHAIYINKQLEILGQRPYQVFPQRTTMVPRHMTLDTSNMVDIIDQNLDMFAYTKTQLYKKVQKHQQHVWSQILKLEKKSIFQSNKYTFHYQIKTDGWDCCLLFILKQYKGKTRYEKVLPPSEVKFRRLETLT